MPFISAEVVGHALIQATLIVCCLFSPSSGICQEDRGRVQVWRPIILECCPTGVRVGQASRSRGGLGQAEVDRTWRMSSPMISSYLLHFLVSRRNHLPLVLLYMQSSASGHVLESIYDVPDEKLNCTTKPLDFLSSKSIG